MKRFVRGLNRKGHHDESKEIIMSEHSPGLSFVIGILNDCSDNDEAVRNRLKDFKDIVDKIPLTHPWDHELANIIDALFYISDGEYSDNICYLVKWIYDLLNENDSYCREIKNHNAKVELMEIENRRLKSQIEIFKEDVKRKQEELEKYKSSATEARLLRRQCNSMKGAIDQLHFQIEQLKNDRQEKDDKQKSD